MPIDTRMPQWMIDRSFSAPNNGVTQSLIAGAQIAAQQEQAAAAREYRASQIRSLDAYRRTQINTQLMKQHQIEAEQTDAALVTEWMNDPRKPVPQGIQTPKGMKAVADMQRVLLQNERNSLFGAVQKGYSDKLKDLDAMGLLKVQQALGETKGVITPAIATMIDAETVRISGTMADLQVLDETGELFVKGGDNRPAFIRSTKTGALHRLPQDWTDQNPVVPLKDADDNILGYGVRNASGGITQLRQQKVTEPTLSVPEKAAMNSEFKTINQWWADMDTKQRSKPENQAELQKRIKGVQDKYTVAPSTAAPSDFQQKYDTLPSGSTYTAPDGTIRTKR